jgi:hypothetical protein
MNIPTKDELRRLMVSDEGQDGAATGPYVSIFMPTHHKGKESVREDPVRFKNQLNEAEEKLMSLGLRRPDVQELLQPAQELLSNINFWEHQSAGLAVFIAPDRFETYSVPELLAEQTIVSQQRFHLKPLMPLVSGDGRFYILALNQNDVRLYEGGRFHISEVDLGQTPRSLAEALALDDPERQLQFHTGTAPGGTGNTLPGAGSKKGPPTSNQGHRDAMFHGHGDALENKDFILRFFQILDKGVAARLRQGDSPCVLAGVEYLLPIYREANSYPHLAEKGITGNPEQKRPEELQQEALAILEPHFRQAREDALERFQVRRQDAEASADIEEIIPAAYYGAVETLFVARDGRQWGTFDPVNNSISLDDDDTEKNEDLLDTAVLHTFLNDGAVYLLDPAEMPAAVPLAAILRYEVTAVPAATTSDEGEVAREREESR